VHIAEYPSSIQPQYVDNTYDKATDGKIKASTILAISCEIGGHQ